MKRFKIALNLYLEYDETEEYILLAVKKAGFDGFYLQWSKEKEDKIRTINTLAKKSNMIFSSIHAPYNKMRSFWFKDKNTQSAVQEQIDCVNFCADINVPIMVIHPYCGFDEPNPNSFGIKNFGKVVEVAERRNVKLAFENVEGEAYLAEIFKYFGDFKNVGLCWDTGHQECYNYGNDIVGKYANGKLFCTHFNDNLGITDKQNITWMDDLHLLPYDGNVNWQEVMQKIKEVGYQDIISFEFKSKNRPNRNEHDRYKNLSLDKYLELAYQRAMQVINQ